MAAHASRCLTDSTGAPRARTLLLRVQPPGDPQYWLDVAARRETKLGQLDTLLRRVWFECCGHLSAFYDMKGQPPGMRRRIDEVIGVTGSQLGYDYDFGSTTQPLVRHLGVLEAAPVKTLRVVARNEAPLVAMRPVRPARDQSLPRLRLERRRVRLRRARGGPRVRRRDAASGGQLPAHGRMRLHGRRLIRVYTQVDDAPSWSPPADTPNTPMAAAESC